MKFAVLGMGRTGHTITSYLMNKGYQVSVWDRNAEKIKIICQNGIQIEGALEGHFQPIGCVCIEDALKEADYIMIMTTANGHNEIAKRMKGKLHHGQRIIIFNCNWGAYEVYHILKDEIKEKNIIVGETGGMLLMSALKGTGACLLKSIKSKLSLATIPAKCCSLVLKELSEAFPQLYGVENVLETSMNATNPVLHAPINLFNLSRIENGEDYLMYGDAATHYSVKYAEEVDKERLTVLRAMGISGTSCLDMLNDAWGSKYENLYDLLKNTKSYKTAKGPDSFSHRHITEDIPFGIKPIQQLGRIYEVKIPYIDNLVKCYELCLGTSFEEQGPDLSAINLSGL
ncbi:NAD/NADP octopine/nopaline dehydrogenase family protein [Lutispora sp.]|uniref:NAD/NADP octopine/nopaline dehydrogenase family protein n=1 Tax=Lutispora sp. TaxID=2828727 RepID=UPI002B1FB07B|nr:NAD/NADP octopine/nopaline dehydrogenase family protein [Lutispora sp.]MEA4962450.1 NAD/NADP octopine/nopaline dehydrogenase family protein [Lutispora sp.]